MTTAILLHHLSGHHHASHCGFGAVQFQVVTEYLVRGLACDDAFQMNLCKSLVAGHLVYDGNEIQRLKSLLKQMDTSSAAGIHSVLWLLSRYAKPHTFLKAVDQVVARRSLHPFTYRLIGGFAARISSDAHAMHKLRMITSQLKDRGAESVFEFMYDLSINEDAWRSILPTLKAPNQTLPMRYSHSKYLLLTAVLANRHLPLKAKELLKKTHAEILGERSYVSNGLF